MCKDNDSDLDKSMSFYKKHGTAKLFAVFSPRKKLKKSLNAMLHIKLCSNIMNVFLNAHDYASNLTRQTVKNISKSVLKIKCIITNISMRTCCVETL